MIFCSKELIAMKIDQEGMPTFGRNLIDILIVNIVVTILPKRPLSDLKASQSQYP